MTREEAIEYNKNLREYMRITDNKSECKFLKENYEALDRAIKALEQEPKTWSLDDAREDFMSDVYNTLDFLPTNTESNIIIDSFDRVTSGIKQESRWIPVSERLPEEETDVLICNTNGEIALSRGSYSTEIEGDFMWYTSGWRFGKVIAWMPMPEPYKRESEVEE